MFFFTIVAAALFNHGSSPEEFCASPEAQLGAPGRGVEVHFSTAHTGAGAHRIQPGSENVLMGAWNVWSRNGNPMMVTDFTVQTMIADTGVYDWTHVSTDMDAKDYIESCNLVDYSTGSQLDMSMAPSGSWSLLDFRPNMVVDSNLVTIAVYCDFSSKLPEGGRDLFAVDTNNTLVQAENIAGTKVDVNVTKNASVGSGSFLTPGHAVKLEGARYVKAQSYSTVYYLDNDGVRWSVPSDDVFYTWEDSMSVVEELPQQEIFAMPWSSTLTVRPGTIMIKIASDTMVFWVESASVDGPAVIRWVETEAVAEEIFDPDWNDYIMTVEDSHFIEYTIGASVDDINDIVVDPSLFKTRFELTE
jgi:hypothetical protein